MSIKKTSVTVDKYIHAPVQHAYLAFTNATAIKTWLCDVATVISRPHGRLYLWWNGDFYSSGEYIEVKENKKVSFTWFGRGDPGPSKITVTFTEEENGVLVRITHTVPVRKKWQGYAENFQKEWSRSLDNLASVLETGEDLRIYNRPMLGINLGDFNAEQAAKLGVPVSEGIRLDGTMEGMGAYAAGLRKDDLLVSFDGKSLTNDFASLTQALQGKNAGDKVEVVYYRGAEKKTTEMVLSRRPVPDIPFDPITLAQIVREKYDKSLAALEGCLRGVTTEEANFKPAPKEWSVKEVLAHLVLGERFFPNYLAQSLGGQELWSDGFAGNPEALTSAVANAAPTAGAMLAELRHLANEMVAFVVAIPPEQVEHKGTYFQVANYLVNSDIHTYTHLEQMKEAITAARKG